MLLNPKSCCVDSPGPVSFQESISSRTMKSSGACRLRRRCPCAPWQPTLGSAEARPARKPSWSHSAFSASRRAQLPLYPPLSPNSLKVTAEDRDGFPRHQQQHIFPPLTSVALYPSGLFWCELPCFGDMSCRMKS